MTSHPRVSPRWPPTAGMPRLEAAGDGVLQKVYDYVAANYAPVGTVGPSKRVVYRRVAVER